MATRRPSAERMIAAAATWAPSDALQRIHAARQPAQRPVRDEPQPTHWTDTERDLDALRAEIRVSAPTGPAAPRPSDDMVRRLRVIQRNYDRTTADERSSCKAGCAACCEGHVVTSQLEAEGIAQNLRARHGAAVVARVAAACEQLLDMAGATMPAWWDARIRCPLLGDDQRCLVYNARPVACRSYRVVSDPALCGARPKSEVTLVVSIPAEVGATTAIQRLGGCSPLRSLHVLLHEIFQRDAQEAG